MRETNCSCEPPGSPLVILIAEDQVVIRAAIAEYLADLGFTVLAAWLLDYRPGIPVLLTSGAAKPPLASPRHRFVSKPYDFALVERHIRELVA